MRPVLSSIAVVFLTVGCAAPINVRNAETHAQAGYAALQRNDWDTARSQFAQAVVNADLAGASPRGRATVNYEYGRALGATCHWQDAEKYLLRSKDFMAQAGQSPHLPILELALLHEKQSHPDRAAAYFEELLPLMEKGGLRRTYPLGVVDVYERYARSLRTAGNLSKGAEAQREADAIRAQSGGAKAFGAVTPYGTRCGDAS